MGFRERVPTYAPSYLRGFHGENLLQAFGAQLDANAEQVMFGRLQGNPYAAGARLADGRLIQCEPFVLPIHAMTRGLRIYSTEPEGSQRYRLSRWLQLHAQRGTPKGIMEHVQPYFLGASGTGTLPVIRIVFQDGAGASATWCTLDASSTYTRTKVTGSNWNWDGQTSKWARWWGIIHLPPGYATGGTTWDGSGVWDGTSIWDGVPAAVIADLWSMMYDWKAAHSRFSGLIITTLQPTDDIPGHTGRKAFDPTDTALTDANGWTSLPTGNWGSAVYTSGPYFGLNSRPPWALFYNIDNG